MAVIYKEIEIDLDEFSDRELLGEVAYRNLALPVDQWPEDVRDAVRDRDAVLLLDIMDNLLFPADRSRRRDTYRRWQHERRVS